MFVYYHTHTHKHFVIVKLWSWTVKFRRLPSCTLFSKCELRLLTVNSHSHMFLPFLMQTSQMACLTGHWRGHFWLKTFYSLSQKKLPNLYIMQALQNLAVNNECETENTSYLRQTEAKRGPGEGNVGMFTWFAVHCWEALVKGEWIMRKRKK